MLVKTSPYISAPEDEGTFDNIETAVADLALAYKRKIRARILEGNPVEAIAAALEEHNWGVQRIAG